MSPFAGFHFWVPIFDPQPLGPEGVGRLFGRWRVARLLEQRPELIALGPCALRLLERTQAEHAKKCLELLGARQVGSSVDANIRYIYTNIMHIYIYICIQICLYRYLHYLYVYKICVYECVEGDVNIEGLCT